MVDEADVAGVAESEAKRLSIFSNSDHPSLPSVHRSAGHGTETTWMLPAAEASMLFLTRTVSSSKVVRCEHAAAINHVRDPEALIRLNPLVVSVQELDSPRPGARKFVVTDRLALGLTTKYTVALIPVDGGVDGHVEAGLGSRLHNQWRVKEVDGGGVEVEETVTATVCYSPLCFCVIDSD